MNRTILAYVLLVAGALALVLFRPTATSVPVGSSDPLAEAAHIESLFNTMSASEAYLAFKREHASPDILTDHLTAHVFGEVLYEQEGLKGFSVCDADFGFGCFHSFIARAIAEHGEEVVQELDRACLDAFTEGGLGCFHGIGHGILSSLGYHLEDVTRALSLCEGLSWQRSYGGCRDGVFMEYNFRTMEADPKERNRPFSLEERHEPCRSIDEGSRTACYFGQPAWWLSALRDAPDARKRMAGYCAEAGATELIQACFRGLGYAYAPESRFDVADGRELCDSSVAEGEERTWCREGLAWALYADPAWRDDALAACTVGSSKEAAAQCEREYLFTIQ